MMHHCKHKHHSYLRKFLPIWHWLDGTSVEHLTLQLTMSGKSNGLILGLRPILTIGNRNTQVILPQLSQRNSRVYIKCTY